MIHYRTDKEIELLRNAALLVGKTLGEVGKHIRPGIRTIELDKIAEEFIRDNGAIPAFKGYGGFPGSLCISVNDAVVHNHLADRVLHCTVGKCFPLGLRYESTNHQRIKVSMYSLIGWCKTSVVTAGGHELHDR